MKLNCILAGVGGQGTVLASKLIAQAAMEKGAMVRAAETIGMAQRGGCVVSHVRAGESVASSMVPKGQADVILGFEPAEAVRCLPYLKEGGAVVVSRKAVKPVTASLSGGTYDGEEMLRFLKEHVENLIVVDGEEICRKCGSSKVLNVALLGAAAGAGALGISPEDLEKTVADVVPQRFVDLNLAAFREGMKAC